MRLAVTSEIHANVVALEAVLTDLGTGARRRSDPFGAEVARRTRCGGGTVRHVELIALDYDRFRVIVWARDNGRNDWADAFLGAQG